MNELRSGVRREGAFFVVIALITNPLIDCNLGDTFYLEMTHFVTRASNEANLPESTAEAIMGIKIFTV